jgi:hypothetical protein
VLANVPESVPPETLGAFGITTTDEYELPPLTFSYDDTPVELPTGLTSDMHVKTVTVTAHEGLTNLSFVRKMRLSVTDPKRNGGQPLVILEYPSVGAITDAAQTSVTMPAQGLDDLVNPWKSLSGTYTLNVWVDLKAVPREVWAVDVTLTFSGSVSFAF